MPQPTDLRRAADDLEEIATYLHDNPTAARTLAAFWESFSQVLDVAYEAAEDWTLDERLRDAHVDDQIDHLQERDDLYAAWDHIDAHYHQEG